MKKTEISLPELIELTLAILVDLNGSGNITEIDDAIAEGYSDEARAVIHNPDKSAQTELAYQSAWARTYLKKAGYLENPARGVWTLTDSTRQKLNENGNLSVDGEKINRINRLGHIKTKDEINRSEPLDDWKKGVPLAELVQPTLDALIELGGSGRINDIYNIVSKKYPSLELHGGGPRTEVEYRLGWARTYLKGTGYIEDSSRGIWTLTASARQELKANRGKLVVDGKEIEKRARRAGNIKVKDGITRSKPTDDWKKNALGVLIDEINVDGFGRLMRMLLLETGFTHVEVTGHAGDGGIDGTGIFRINGLIGLRVAFQCKKQRSSVRAPEIQKFRGSMGGRADRGIFITTSIFTKAATEDASRVLPPIDLIDGDDMAEMLKKFSLGVTTERLERVTVDHAWFQNL